MDVWTRRDDQHPDEYPTDTVVIDGVLQWGSYTLACPSCHAWRRWSLSVQREPLGSGERAWRVCAHGHRSTHPLVYPAIVHALITWANTTVFRPPLTYVLRDWHPHRMVWHTRGAIPELQWRSWNEPAPPGYWATRWPELLRAARLGPRHRLQS